MKSKILILLIGATVAFPMAAQQHNFRELYSFQHAPDGTLPVVGVTWDSAGNLYGTTSAGGTSGNGTIFELDTAGIETVLYSFTGAPDGAHPEGKIVRDEAGNIYGTTYDGGAVRGCSHGCGAVFKLDASGNETVLYSFTGGADGGNPNGGVIRDQAGNLYGTTYQGGISGSGCYGVACGIVFRLDTEGKLSVLHSFAGGPDGGNPYAGLVRDAVGNLYGTTEYGGDLPCSDGADCGTVFKLDTAGKETVLHTFTGPPDGAFPLAGVVLDAAGDLYGTTDNGGNSTCDCGVIFTLAMNGEENVLYSFEGGKDGEFPVGAGVVLDGAGNLYGTTYFGGGAFSCASFGCGTVYMLDTSDREMVLHVFTNSPDGAHPSSGLVRNAAGNLFGTTQLGGTSRAGTVFKVNP